MVKLVVLFSGKRKSGKDFVSHRLRDLLAERVSVLVRGVSYSLKEEYSRIHGLNYDELISDGPYKEEHRLKMIKWGEELRNREPDYFCRQTVLPSCPSDVVIVSDCRRPTDIQYFESNYRTLSVRVESSVSEREKRGFKFVTGVDDAESECGLDDWTFDVIVNNNGNCINNQLTKLVASIEKLLYMV